MKILFSPSEGKNSGGSYNDITKAKLLFNNHHDKRLQALQIYHDYIKTATQEQLIKLFGTKKPDIIENYSQDIYQSPLLKPILRYSGVAYDYIAYESLTKDQMDYIDNNTIIFSNLFGPLLAGGDGIPDYKLKQGESLGDFKLEKFYKDNFSDLLDDFLKDEEVIDLRAGFYEKFYKNSKPYTTIKFLKAGKVVSHWAKAYRGTILKELAKNSITNIDALIALNIPNLSIIEIQKVGLKQEIIYEISNS